LERSIALSPTHIDLWKDWAEMLYEDGNIRGAITFLEEGIKSNPLAADLYYLCAVYLIEIKKETKGWAMLENGLLLDASGWERIVEHYPELAEHSVAKALIKTYLK
jgi:tetratricopeptide (TPR) repeat protein